MENKKDLTIKALNTIILILLMNSVIFGLINFILVVKEASMGLIINLLPALYIMFFIKPIIKNKVE